jgi:hypothetical protein
MSNQIECGSMDVNKEPSKQLQLFEVGEPPELSVSCQTTGLRLLPQLSDTDKGSAKHSSLSWSNEFGQLLVPLLIAGFGNVLTGYLLSYSANELLVFQALPQLIIVVPALLGLKGASLLCRVLSHTRVLTSAYEL